MVFLQGKLEGKIAHMTDREAARIGLGPIFHNSHKVYMKEICTISSGGLAKPVLQYRGDTLMAVATYGKGTVFAIVQWVLTQILRVQ